MKRLSDYEKDLTIRRGGNQTRDNLAVQDTFRRYKKFTAFTHSKTPRKLKVERIKMRERGEEMEFDASAPDLRMMGDAELWAKLNEWRIVVPANEFDPVAYAVRFARQHGVPSLK